MHTMSLFAGFRSIDNAREWFDDRRWFGDKGREITSLSSRFAIDATVDGSTLRVEMIEVGFAEGDASRYLLLRSADDPAVDRIEDAAVRSWLISGFGEERSVTGSDGELRWSVTDASTAWWDIAGPSRVFRGEQSNSSIVYGDSVMLKLFRKMRSGENPEVEIGRHLTMHSDFKAFPRLLGTISLAQGDRATTIAAAQQFVVSKGDAWSWWLDGLADPEFATQSVMHARTLGERTAQMHAALANGAARCFEPELIAVNYVDEVHGDALRELNDTLGLLEGRAGLDVAGLRASLSRNLTNLKELEGTFRSRIHGDYHLGQVLRSVDGDFAILDFEGEPSRSIEDRRAKASPLRDVAGMLRSFDYAAETAIRRYPGDTSNRFSVWRSSVRQAFSDGYASEAQASQQLMAGLDLERRQRLIVAFEVHKALYEVRYELWNRPDWLDIPLNGLQRIAGLSQ